MLQGHGDDSALLGTKPIADFSSNVWHQAMPDDFYEHLQASLQNIGNYPAPCAENLAEKIAQYHQCSPDNILVCNGATEAFYLMAHAFTAQKSCIPIPSFSEYADACLLYKHHITHPLYTNFDLAAIPDTDLVWLCNPNNPDGCNFSADALTQAAEKHRNKTFIIDEAYTDFNKDAQSVSHICSTHQNMVVVRSMTKKFHMPGLRLGYIIAHRSLIENFRQHKMPWSVNSVAIAAGEYIFDNDCVNPNFDIERALNESALLQKRIAELHQFQVHFTSNCYFLVETLAGTASGLKSFLWEEYKILIRDASNFKGLTNGFFRLASQSEEKNNYLLTALKQWNKQRA